jgi:hypothetical protein
VTISLRGCWSSAAIEHVLLRQAEEGLHGGAAPAAPSRRVTALSIALTSRRDCIRSLIE